MLFNLVPMAFPLEKLFLMQKPYKRDWIELILENKSQPKLLYEYEIWRICKQTVV